MLSCDVQDTSDTILYIPGAACAAPAADDFEQHVIAGQHIFLMHELEHSAGIQRLLLTCGRPVDALALCRGV